MWLIFVFFFFLSARFKWALFISASCAPLTPSAVQGDLFIALFIVWAAGEHKKAINYTWRSCLFPGLKPLNHPLSWLACWFWACLSNITRWVLKAGLLQARFPGFRQPRCTFVSFLENVCVSASGRDSSWQDNFSRGNQDGGTWLGPFLACWERYLLQLANFDCIQFLQSSSHICNHMDKARHGRPSFLMAALHVKVSFVCLGF